MASEMTLEQKTWHQLECAANSVGGIEVAMVSLPIAQVKALVEGRNTRPAPAATDTGLVTIGRKERSPHGVHFLVDLPEGTELVTRSQAEELLAAERAEKEIAERNRDAARENFLTMQKTAAKLLERAEKAEADNAAQAARIKELEKINADLCRSHGVLNVTGAKLEGQVEALEAKLETYHEEYENRKEGYEKTIDSLEEKLAAAEKALARMVSEYDEVDLSHDEPPSMTSAVMEARAVLGGKPL